MNQDWLMVAQVYATLSAGWRGYQAEHEARGVALSKTAREQADTFEQLARAALRAAGVQE